MIAIQVRSFFFFLSVFVSVFCFSARASAEFLQPHTSAEQAILVDFDTKAVLFEKNADQRMPTSSMSKAMTLYMVFQALKDGRITPGDTFPVSEKAWRKGGSKMFVEVGNRVEIAKLIRGVAVQSGNDAAIVLAEGLAGSEDAFAQAMTRQAHSMGMTNSSFINASGWPHPDHYSTARDLSVLARHLISDFPEEYQVFSEKEFTYNEIRQTNRNPLLYRDIGADGIKTGHTDAGGYGLIGSGSREGRRVILVVNALKSSKDRAQEASRLLEWGLRGFKNRTILVAGETVSEIPVVMGKSETLPLTIEENVNLSFPILAKKDIRITANYPAPIPAPVSKGDEIGSLEIKIPGMATHEYKLIAAQGVEKLGFFSATFAKAHLFFKKLGEGTI